jgi:hypothetical protein
VCQTLGIPTAERHLVAGSGGDVAHKIGAQPPPGTKSSQVAKGRTEPLAMEDGLDGMVSVNTAGQQRVKALHGVPGLKIVARAHGTVTSRVPWTAPPVAYTSITYTYRDGARGRRWVTTRFIDTLEHGKRAYIEVTVGGRPQDQAGLNRVLAEATQRVALVG